MFQDYCSAHGKPCMANSLYCSYECMMLDLHQEPVAHLPLLMYECPFCSSPGPCEHQHKHQSQYQHQHHQDHHQHRHLVPVPDQHQLEPDQVPDQVPDQLDQVSTNPPNQIDQMDQMEMDLVVPDLEYSPIYVDTNTNYSHQPHNIESINLTSAPPRNPTIPTIQTEIGVAPAPNLSPQTVNSPQANLVNNSILDTLMEFDRFNHSLNNDSNYVQLNYKKWLVNLSPHLS